MITGNDPIPTVCYLIQKSSLAAYERFCSQNVITASCAHAPPDKEADKPSAYTQMTIM